MEATLETLGLEIITSNLMVKWPRVSGFMIGTMEPITT